MRSSSRSRGCSGFEAGCLLAALVAGACAGGGQPTAGPAAEAGGRAAGPGEDWFVERAEASGLDFVHFNGATGRFYYPEILPPGVALVDFDNDGDLDIFVVQGRVLAPDQSLADARIPPRDARGLTARLFRNDLPAGTDGAGPRFTDVTASSGLDLQTYGLGVATGDIDNDGLVDLLVTGFDRYQLFRNLGHGKFEDVTASSGVRGEPGVTVAAAFLDYDRDGWLDLYVGYNVDYALARERPCPNMAGARDYCPPQIYGGRPDHLYRNLGGGRFRDVSRTALVGGTFGPALGVVTADFNGDGWIDIYVANDGEPNLLWINQRDGTFRDTAMLGGAALTAEGRAEASMGVDAGDFDGDGDEDLVMTELTGQGSNLFVNDGKGSFRDASAASGIGPLTMAYTGWGTKWIDVDNDGWLDVLAVNGTIIMAEGRAHEPFPYDQRKLLLRNPGAGRFENVTREAGAAFAASESGRGAAFGDIDNDGDTDVLVGNDAGRLRLLVNQVGNRRHWVGLRIVGRQGRDALGARVGIARPDGTTLWRRVRTDGSYASANDPRVLAGLGSHSGPVDVSVQWPDGRTEGWRGVPVDRWTTLVEGGGR